jgi:peptide/nickel transport system permease protein
MADLLDAGIHPASPTARRRNPARVTRREPDAPRRDFVRSAGAVLGSWCWRPDRVALLAPWISPQNPYDLSQLDIMDNMLAPGGELASGITAFLGTDDQGRDMLSAILYGMRISLAVGAASVLIACAVGASVGVLAAYAGGGSSRS